MTGQRKDTADLKEIDIKATMEGIKHMPEEDQKECRGIQVGAYWSGERLAHTQVTARTTRASCAEATKTAHTSGTAATCRKEETR